MSWGLPEHTEVGKNGGIIPSEVVWRLFAWTKDEIAALIKCAVQPHEYLVLRGYIEIHHYMPADDQIESPEHALGRHTRPLFEQIMPDKTHRPTKFRTYRIRCAMLREIPLKARVRHMSDIAFGIQSFPRVGERLLVDVRPEHRDRNGRLIREPQFPHEHGNRVRLLPGRASRGPDPHPCRLVRVPVRGNLRQHNAGEKLEDQGIAEKMGDLNREGCEELPEFHPVIGAKQSDVIIDVGATANRHPSFDASMQECRAVPAGVNPELSFELCFEILNVQRPPGGDSIRGHADTQKYEY